MEKVKKIFNKKKMAILLLIILLGVVLAAAVVVRSRKNSDSAVAASSALQTYPIEKQDLKNSFSVTGTVESVAQTSVVSELSGVEVKEVYVTPGKEVKAGDPICLLDSEALEKKLALEQKTASTDIAKANAEVGSADKNLADAKTTKDIQNTRAAEDVAAAKQKQDSSEGNKNTAAAALQQSQQNLSAKMSEADQLNKNLNNVQTLIANLEQQKTDKESVIQSLTQEISSSGLSEDEISKKKQELATAQSDLISVEAELAQAESQQQTCSARKQEADSKVEELKTEVSARQTEYNNCVTEAESAKETYQKALQNQSDTARSQETTVRTSEESLQNSKLNAATAGLSTQSTIDELKKQIEQTTVKAPADGTVTAVSVKKGDTFKSGEVAVIQNLEQFKITASVDQYDISKVQEGMKAVISVDATGQETLTGTVSFVSPVPKTETLSSGSSSQTSAASAGSSSYTVEITLDTTSEKLRAGMSVKTELITEQKEDCLAVPYDCISSESEDEYFITVTETGENNTVNQKKISVKKGMETDYYVEIISDDVKEGMEVLAQTEEQSEMTEVVTDGVQ